MLALQDGLPEAVPENPVFIGSGGCHTRPPRSLIGCQNEARIFFADRRAHAALVCKAPA